MKRSVFQRSLVLAFLLSATPGVAQPPAGRATALLPPLSPSPIDLFRRLLATNETGRAQFTAGKAEPMKQYIESRIREFEIMPVNQRDAKLQALELRWYMPQVMKLKPADRASRLETVPEPMRSIIRQRLLLWDILPPQLQQEVLDNETAIKFFERPEQAAGSEGALGAMSVGQRSDLEKRYREWMALSDVKRREIIGRFDEFVGMPEAAKSNALTRLTNTDYAQMQQTLSQFNNLSKEQRVQAMQGFRKFAELSPAERAAFLKTADRWRTMSEKDRDLWRNVVSRAQAARTNAPPPMPGNAKLPETATFFAIAN
jgi:hypothetical protein